MFWDEETTLQPDWSSVYRDVHTVVRAHHAVCLRSVHLKQISAFYDMEFIPPLKAKTVHTNYRLKKQMGSERSGNRNLFKTYNAGNIICKHLF